MTAKAGASYLDMVFFIYLFKERKKKSNIYIRIHFSFFSFFFNTNHLSGFDCSSCHVSSLLIKVPEKKTSQTWMCLLDSVFFFCCASNDQTFFSTNFSEHDLFFPRFQFARYALT